MDLSNENIIHVRNNGVEYLQFRRLLEYDDILTHCFTIKPLDFGNNSNYDEKKIDITNDYKLICNELKIDFKNIVRPYQTHTNIVKQVNNEEGIFADEFVNVDGLITNRSNKALSLSFADCTPIYLFDPNKKVIGDIHSGWQGTVKKIAKKSIEKMIEIYGCNPNDIICAIGPTIRKCHFEVEDDVKDKFENVFGYMDNIIFNSVGVGTLDDPLKNNTHKYYIDTVKINRIMLKEMGVLEENIIDSNICTLCNSDIIYSYRDNQNPGRNTAIIMLK